LIFEEAIALAEKKHFGWTLPYVQRWFYGGSETGASFPL